MQKIRLEPDRIKEGPLVLINAKHPYHQNNHLELAYVQKERLQIQAAKALTKLLVQSQRLVCVSGYRTHQCQQELYERCLEEHGLKYTQQYVALPGCSEHESGLAIDLSLSGCPLDLICPSFQDDPICEWFGNEAVQVGFIERYLEKDQAATGIAKEPWHFRYVGHPHALIMRQHDCCLEDYHTFVRQYDLYNPLIYTQRNWIYEIFFMPLLHPQTLCLKDDVSYSISGNNMDGVIVTCRRRV